MAEASPQPGRYFCHCCSVEIVPRLPVRSGREGGGAVRARRARGEAETRWRASSVADRSEDPGLWRGVPRRDVWRWSDSAGIGTLSSAPGTVAERVARTRGRAARPRALTRASQLRPEELQIRRRSLGGSGLVAPTPHLVVTGLVLLLQCGFGQLHPQNPTRVSPSFLLLPGGFG